MIKARLLSLALFSLLTFALGCGGNKLTPSSVSGNLTYKGQPIKGGAIHFHTENGPAYPGTIRADGSYSAIDLPTGEMVVTVDTESLNPNRDFSGGEKGAKSKADTDKRMKAKSGMQQARPAGVGGDPAELYVKIPQKYAAPKTSPLKVTLSAGSQTHNFELVD